MHNTLALKKVSSGNILLYSIIALLILSGLAGGIIGNNLDSIVFSYFSTEGSLIDSILKYGRIALIIWIAGFFKFGTIVQMAMIAFVGFSYGFSSTIVIMNFGFQINILLPIFVQAVVIVPTYIFMTVAGVEYFLNNHSCFMKKMVAYRNFQRINNADYMVVLGIGFALCIVAVLLEIYAVPFMLLI